MKRMLKINYNITTLAPVTFAEKSGDNVLFATKRYVPGSAVRGALAATYIKENNLKAAHLDDTFNDLFLSGKVRFLPAYPKCEGINKEACVIPLSLMASKDGKSIKDFAWDNTPIPGYKKLSGFAVIDHTEQKLYETSTNIQIEFHMSRCSEGERSTGSSKVGNVYNYEYLEPYQEFIGSIIVDDENKELVDSLLPMLNEKLYLGRSKNTQYGICKFSVLDMGKVDDVIINDVEKVYLYAHTSYIPFKDWQRVDVIAQDLEGELNSALKERGIAGKVRVVKEKVYAVVESIDGYVGVWNMKRERKNAIAAGSLIGINLKNFDDEAKACLQAILYAGMGDRTVEGFGQFRLWNPMVNISKGNVVEEAGLRANLNKVVVERACAIIQKRILQEVHKKAKEDADAICRKQSRRIADAKGTLKRLESLMDSVLTKSDIQTKIADEFRQIAMQNLRELHIADSNMWDCLLENNNATMPYAGINWGKKLELDEAVQASLEKDLGKNALRLSDDIIFKEYWLWFTRFSAKYKKVEGSSMKDVIVNTMKKGE